MIRRVVHLSTVHHPHDTRILYRECVSLKDNGYDVTLLVCSDKPINVDGVNIVTFPPPKNRSMRMSLTAYQFLKKAIELDADIYHFHDPELIPWMLLLKIFKQKKIIFDVHENIIGSLTDRDWIPKPLLHVILNSAKIFLPIIMRPFNIIFAERSYSNIYPWVKDYEVICNFPKTKNFPKRNLEKYPVFSVVYIGGITIPRGVIEMLDALQILQNRNINVDFYLIGKVSLPKNVTLEKLIEERSLKNVKFYSYTPQPEAMEIIARCHLGLAILHPVANYLISYPTKIFEYMGCGIPFITSDFPLYQQIIDKWQCGLTTNPQDAKQLADKIEALTKEPEKLLDMGARGGQAVDSEYSWVFEETKLLSLYQKLFPQSNATKK